MERFQILESFNKKIKFIIEEDLPEVGCYLLIYDGEKCIKDYLQNNIENAKNFAYEKYSVPINSWVNVHKASE